MGSKKKMDSRLRGNDELQAEADKMLGTIQMYSDDIEGQQIRMEAELDAIRTRYAVDLSTLVLDRHKTEQTLKKFALKNKVDLFGVDGDKVSLSHGIILYAKEDKVSIPKDAVEKIEGLGWSEGIVTIKAIDRPVIEAWNDEKLAAIGATKKPKVTISWELKKQEDQKLRRSFFLQAE